MLSTVMALFPSLFLRATSASRDNLPGPTMSRKMIVRQGYNLIHWNHSGMTYCAVSDLNISELQEFA